MRRKLLALVCALAVGLSVLVTAPAEAASTVGRPSKITSVSAKPGPGVGEVTIHWKSAGKNTTSFKIETAVSSFSKTDASMPRSGRKSTIFRAGKTRRSVTLSAAQMAAAGASVSSGNVLYFRIFAVNKRKAGTRTRAYPYLMTALPRPVSPKAAGTALRVGTFNVRTARATTDERSWLERAPDVASEILSRNPGLLAVQELGPGRADGKPTSTVGSTRQTESLETALARAGGSRYQLVRTTPYVKPGTSHGTQGARILYDTSRYVLRSTCPETTDGRSYSGSCSIGLPILSGDSEGKRRRAAYAEFADRRNGARFFVVSAHLDDRHSTNASTEARYDALRGRQAAAITSHLAKINTGNRPVIFGGDINSWQNSPVGNTAHDVLISRGFYDTAAALTKINLKYSTKNGFDTTVRPNGKGVGARLDVVLVKGSRGSQRIENVMQRVDPTRPSDHNLVVSDVVL